MTYAPNGSVLTGNDSINGNWSYGYDDFNRLISSNKNSGQQTFTSALQQLKSRLNNLYAKIGRPSIAPEKLLRALLLQGGCTRCAANGC